MKKTSFDRHTSCLAIKKPWNYPGISGVYFSSSLSQRTNSAQGTTIALKPFLKTALAIPWQTTSGILPYKACISTCLLPSLERCLVITNSSLVQCAARQAASAILFIGSALPPPSPKYLIINLGVVSIPPLLARYALFNSYQCHRQGFSALPRLKIIVLSAVSCLSCLV